MTDPDRQRTAIRDAMARLLDGAPIRSDGKLTIKSLAVEADVKRWLLTHRHTDLQQEFRDRVASHGQDPEPVRLLKEANLALEAENTRLRGQLREARATCSLLERHIAVDALERLRNASTGGERSRLRSVPTEPDSDPR